MQQFSDQRLPLNYYYTTKTHYKSARLSDTLIESRCVRLRLSDQWRIVELGHAMGARGCLTSYTRVALFGSALSGNDRDQLCDVRLTLNAIS